MPKETFVSPEIAIIKNIQSKIRGMEKYFRQLTGDPSIIITLNTHQNAIIISSKELSEETVAILKKQIEPFHTKFKKKTNETKIVGQSEFEKNKITTTFNTQTQLLDFCTEFKRRFQAKIDYSSTFRDLGFIYYLDNDNKLKIVNILENILIEIKNERIKKHLENTNPHSVKKTSAEITKLTTQAATIKEKAQKMFIDNQCENESYKNLGKQMQQISAALYQNARAESYDHHEQSKNSAGIFYFHLTLFKADEVYAKAHVLHEGIHSLGDLVLETEKTKQKVLPAAPVFESLDEILNKLNFTGQVEFIENLSIRYCEVLENLIEEICPSINDDSIRKTYKIAVEAINTFKTDSALSSTERLDQLQMFLGNLILTFENINSEKQKSITATQPSQKSTPPTTGSFSGLRLFNSKKTHDKQAALPSETKTESPAGEIFILEVLKKTQHSIEKLLMEENKESFGSTKLSQ